MVPPSASLSSHLAFIPVRSRSWGIALISPQPALQIFDLGDEVERQCHAGHVETEIALQPLGPGDMHEADLCKAPLAARSSQRIERTMFDKVSHPTGFHLAGQADVFQRTVALRADDFGIRARACRTF